MGFLLQDLRFALRLMRRNAGFTITVVSALALGIGANTTIFSLVNGILLKPYPFPSPEQLVMVWQRNASSATAQAAISPPDFEIYNRQTGVFSDVAAMRSQDFHYLGGSEPRRLRGAVVSWNYFRLLGAQPILGRAFLREEGTRGNDRVALLSYSAWRSYFGGDPEIIGQKVVLNKEPYTVVGVLPAFLEEYRRDQVYTPMAFQPEELTTRNARYLYVMARLKPGMTSRDADLELQAISSRLAREYPVTNGGWEAYCTPLLENEVSEVRPALLLLLSAVGLVLLVACANVANLLLVRAAARQKEVAIRGALGAGRGRIAVQMLVEGFVLACVSAAVGTILAYWVVRALVAYGPSGIPRLSYCTVDAKVLLFTLAVAGVTAVLFGLAPSLHAVRGNLQGALQEVGRGLSSGGHKSVLRSFIVVGEVAFCTVLLVSAGLMLRSFYNLYRLDPGFKPDHVLAVFMPLNDSKYFDDSTCVRFVTDVIQRVKQIPGVVSGGAGTSLPMMQVAWQAQIAVDGQTPRVAGDRDVVTYAAVTPGYFGTLGIPLLRGRDFTARDGIGAPSVVIISESLAKRYFPNVDPVGKHIQLSVSMFEHHSEVVGVVGDAKQVSLDESDRPMIYQPHAQSPWIYLAFAFRTSVPPLDVANEVRARIRELEPAQAVDRVETMDELLADSFRIAAWPCTRWGSSEHWRCCWPPSAFTPSWPTPSSSAHRNSACASLLARSRRISPV